MERLAEEIIDGEPSPTATATEERAIAAVGREVGADI
jgi:hypothetical protein